MKTSSDIVRVKRADDDDSDESGEVYENPVRKRRRMRKTLNDLNDEELYRYVQLKALERVIFYHPLDS